MSQYLSFITMWDLSPIQVCLCGHHYSNFLLDFMATFKSSAPSHLMTHVSCIVSWQPSHLIIASYFHHLLPHCASVRLAMSRSFQTTEQSTSTIFMSCFHTGTQTSFLFWPHAYFSFKSPVQHLVALPAKMAIYSRCTSAQPWTASAFPQCYFYHPSQNLIHFLCHHSSSSSVEVETSVHCKAMTDHLLTLCIIFSAYIKTFGKRQHNILYTVFFPGNKM